jgi:hypothetical protein
MQHRATLGITGCGGWLMRWPTFMPTRCAARQAARGESVKESGGQQRTWRCSSGSGVTQPKSDQVECGTAAAQAQGSCAHMQKGFRLLNEEGRGQGYFMMRAFLDFWASTRTIAACRERWQPLRRAVRPRACEQRAQRGAPYSG